MTELTVVVSTYNGSRHLAATLDSLARQSAPLVVLVVDDGSADESARLAAQHAVVSQVLIQPNRGVAAARNRGLAVASTKYVAFLDQDDLWHMHRAARLLKLAGESGAAAVGTSEQTFALASDRERLEEMGDERAAWPATWISDGDEGALASDSVLGGSGKVEQLSVDRLMLGPIAVTTSLMYEREAAIIAGGCATFVRAADDHVLNVSMANLFGPLVRIDEQSLFYRIHPAATTNSSPLAAPFLSLQLALRYGRALPSEPTSSPFLDHLMWQLISDSDLSRKEQLALLMLSSSNSARVRWLARWGKRSGVSRVR